MAENKETKKILTGTCIYSIHKHNKLIRTKEGRHRVCSVFPHSSLVFPCVLLPPAKDTWRDGKEIRCRERNL